MCIFSLGPAPSELFSGLTTEFIPGCGACTYFCAHMTNESRTPRLEPTEPEPRSNAKNGRTQHTPAAFITTYGGLLWSRRSIPAAHPQPPARVQAEWQKYLLISMTYCNCTWSLIKLRMGSKSKLWSRTGLRVSVGSYSVVFKSTRFFYLILQLI